MKNVICFVLATQKYEDRICRIEKTWGNDIDTIFYSDHEVRERNIINVYDKQDYVSAEIKQSNVLNLIKTMPNIINSYDWVCFSDDDTFFNTRLLKETVQHLDKNKSYGRVITYENDPNNPIYKRNEIPKDLKYPNGGAGFLISTEKLTQIPEFRSYNTGFSDVTYGLNLYYNSVEMIHIDLFHSQPPSFYNHNESIIPTKISYHYITSDETMFWLYKLTTEKQKT